MLIKVYQIPHDIIAGPGPDAGRSIAGLAMMNGYSEKYRSMYEHVADIEAENLDDAFHVSNCGTCEALITRHRNMHSISVGDILEYNGKWYGVDPVGFTVIGDAPHGN